MDAVPVAAERVAGDRRTPRTTAATRGRESAARSGPSGNSSTPAGIETNERTSGVSRPKSTNAAAVALEPALGAREALRAEVQPAAVALDQRPPAGAPERPAGRASRRGSRACRPRSTAASDGPGVAGDRPGRERAGEQHDQLAAGGQHGVDRHQHEHGDQAVLGDPVGELSGHGAAQLPTGA